MAICPRCKNEETDINKSWDVVPKSGKGRAMRVTLHSCNSCGNKFRTGARIDISASTPTEKLSATALSNPSSEVTANVPITSETHVNNSGPDTNRIISADVIGELKSRETPSSLPESTHTAGLFEKIKRAFSG